MLDLTMGARFENTGSPIDARSCREAVTHFYECRERGRTRRSFVEGSCCIAALWSTWSVAAEAHRVVGGCSELDAAGEEAIHELDGGANSQSARIFFSSGNARLDAALGELLADIAARYGVRPGFAIYDDSAKPNAVALENTVFPGTSGTVLCGMSILFDSLFDQKRGDIFITSVLAHEFGHILQNSTSFKNRLSKNQATAQLIELHADFLAGFYLAKRGDLYQPKQLAGLGPAWESLGDSNYTSPMHHGTSEQRIAAIEAGFNIARERPSFDALDICEVGARYLGSFA